jgi:hypothetical protein
MMHVQASVITVTSLLFILGIITFGTPAQEPGQASAYDLQSLNELASAGAFHQTRQRSAGAVLRSLVPAAQGVYTLIVEHQVDDPESEGLDFKLLYRWVTLAGVRAEG